MVGCNPSSVIAYEDSTLRHMYPTMAKVDTSWVDTSFVVNIEELLKLEPDVVFQWNYDRRDRKDGKRRSEGHCTPIWHYGRFGNLDSHYFLCISRKNAEKS